MSGKITTTNEQINICIAKQSACMHNYHLHYLREYGLHTIMVMIELKLVWTKLNCNCLCLAALHLLTLCVWNLT